jgi:hypothetical protein
MTIQRVWLTPAELAERIGEPEPSAVEILEGVPVARPRRGTLGRPLVDDVGRLPEVVRGVRGPEVGGVSRLELEQP